MIGKKFIAPTGNGSEVEGIVTYYNDDSGKVTLFTDSGDFWKGYEYQLQEIE